MPEENGTARASKSKAAWNVESATTAVRSAHEAARKASLDEDAAQDALLRMIEKGEAPERAAGYTENLAREKRKREARRNAIAPVTNYDPKIHDLVEADDGSDARIVHHEIKPDYAGQFAAAAQGARYMANVLANSTAPMLEGIARELGDAEPSVEMLDALAWLGEVQRAFSRARQVLPTASQIALSITVAMKISRPHVADLAEWVLTCIRIDFPGAVLRVDERVRAALRSLPDCPRDAELAALAGALAGQPVKRSAVKVARNRSNKQR